MYKVYAWREGQKLWQSFCRTDKYCICKTEKQKGTPLPSLRNATFIKFGLNIMIAIGSKFDRNCGSYKQKTQKAGELTKFCIAGWISMPVLYFSGMHG